MAINLTSLEKSLLAELTKAVAGKTIEETRDAAIGEWVITNSEGIRSCRINIICLLVIQQKVKKEVGLEADSESMAELAAMMTADITSARLSMQNRRRVKM